MLTLKQSLLLVVGGVVAAELWVTLFGIWAVFDTPLLKFGLGVGLSVVAAAFISMSLFALVSAIMFTLPLSLFFRRSLVAAAAVFISGFLATFVIPALFESEPFSLLSSLSNVWFFFLSFGLCVALVRIFRHA